MKNLILKILIFFSLSNIVHAQEEMTVELEPIVVTPSRIEEKISSAINTVTVMGEKTLEKRGLYTVKDAMKQDYSSDVVQAGSYGGTSSVFLRGANAGHTRVMLDGIRIYDPISPDGSLDFAHLTTDNVDRIEIVKGPQSSLYGSDAIGGVINVISKKGEGVPKFSLFEEAGTYYTRREGLDFSGQKDKLHFSLSGSHLRSKSFSRAAERFGNPERDPYQNNSYAARLDYDLSDDLTLGLLERFSYAKYSYDDSAGSGGDDPNRKGWSKQGISGISAEHKLSDNLEQKILLSWMGNFRRDFDESDSIDAGEYLRDWFYGQTQQADWQITYKMFDFNTILAGFNYLREKGESYYYLIFDPLDPIFGTAESIFPKRYAWTRGYFIENRWNITDNLLLNGSLRLEDHSRFNTNNTYRINSSYKFANLDTKIKTSFGTGFKAPTLYQLFVPSDPFFGGGNPNLAPEKSESFEASIEQPLFEDKVNLSLTYFHNRFKNLIDAVTNPVTFITEQYKNVNKARTFGYEQLIEIKPIDDLKISGSYSWLDTENKETHDELLRRAKNKINLNFDYLMWKKLGLNLNLGYVGHRQDSGGLLLKRYTKVDFSGYYDINDYIKIYSRIENLLDKKYEEIKGYGTPGFSMFGGLEVKF